MKYLKIRKTISGGYVIRAECDGTVSGSTLYFGYSKAAAIRKFRIDHGYVGKHFTIIDL